MLSWLAQYNEEEAVFRRPLAERFFSRAFAGGFAYFISFVLFPTYRGKPAGQGMFIQSLLLFGIVFLFYSFMAGLKDMHFDFRRKRYRGRMGYPFLSWTQNGDFSEISHLAVWNHKFTGLSIEWKNAKRLQTTFVSCSTKGEAQALAQRLGVSIGVPVRAGIVRGLKQSVR